MAAGQIFKFIIKVGKQFMGTNSKSIANELVRQGGKRVPKNKVPESATVKKAPSVANPRNSKGNYTRPQPPAARPKTTSPARPSAPKSTSPAKPNTQTTAPARPKPATKAPARPAGGSTGSRNTGGRGRKKAPLMDKKLVRERPNLPPAPKTSRPAIVRDSARPSAPEITKDDLKPIEKKKEGTPSKRLDKKGETPKAPPKKKPTVKPKLRPATGPVTNESFGKAFARNRKAGNATFTWKGNKYTTRYKEESIAQHKKKFGVEGKY